MADLSTRGNFARHKNCPLYPIFMPKFEPEMIRVFLSGKAGLSRKAGFSGKAGISDPVPSPMESRECALGHPSHGTARRIDLPDGNVAARLAGSGPALASAIGVCNTPQALGGGITAQGHLLLEVGA